MDASLPFRGGRVTLTPAYVLVIHEEQQTESLALKHLSAITMEEAHSFRHRFLGTVIGIGFLFIVVAPIAAAPWRENGGIVIFNVSGMVIAGCSGFFSLVFLCNVVTSRRIWWLRLRYGNARKLIPLPDVDPLEAEQFVQRVSSELGR